MTLDGAMADDIDCFAILLDGNYMLPKDNHGRAVDFSDKSRSTNERLTKDEQLRILWYYVHSAIENESVQRAGFILTATYEHDQSFRISTEV
jgi:predicted component of type VI protein secretion system